MTARTHRFLASKAPHLANTKPFVRILVFPPANPSIFSHCKYFSIRIWTLFLVQEAKELDAFFLVARNGSMISNNITNDLHIGHKMWVWFPVCPLKGSFAQSW